MRAGAVDVGKVLRCRFKQTYIRRAEHIAQPFILSLTAVAWWQWLAAVVIHVAMVIFLYAIILPAVLSVIGIVHSIVVHFNVVPGVTAFVVGPVMPSELSVMAMAVVLRSHVMLLGLGISEAEGQ